MGNVQMHHQTIVQKKRAAGGGGGGSWTLVASAQAKDSDGSGTETSSAINTTGANLIVIGLTNYTSMGTVSDSKGNTWTALTAYGNTPKSGIYYCINPTVGSGHTFTNNGDAVSFQVVAFTGPADPTSLSVSGVGGVGAPANPGSLSASGTTLFVTIAGWFNSGSIEASIDDGFTLVAQNQPGGGWFATSALAWKESASAQDPTWSWSGSPSSSVNASMATFN